MAKPLTLIIEDDPHQAEVCVVTLQHAKYNTEVIPDGQLALDRLSNTSPDLVIVDLHMPSVSGLSILEYIQGDRRLSQTKTILITADAEHARRCQLRVDAILVKPFSISELLAIAKQLHPATRY
ncbi:MAG: response regulator [Chloroflexota bacterium]